SLDAFVARLLAKDPVLRPRDAAQVAAELRRIGEASAPAVTPMPTALTAGEQRVLSVILATMAQGAPPVPRPESKPSTQALDGWDEAPRPRDDGDRPAPPRVEESGAAARPSGSAATEPWDRQLRARQEEEDPHAPLRALAEVYDGNLEELADGSLVVTLK